MLPPSISAAERECGRHERMGGWGASATRRGPGSFDTDLNLKKEFAYKERYKLSVGAYFFNILNHPNFDQPGNNIAAGNFGQILNSVSPPSSAYGSFQGSAVSGRLVQMLVKFAF